MTSVQMGGVLLGAFLSGYLTDTFGRRIPLYVTSLCHVVMSLVAAFSVRWQMFVVMRMLIGVTIGVYDVSYFSYPLEFVSPKYRQVRFNLPTAREERLTMCVCICSQF